jgi:hypothetical protein
MIEVLQAAEDTGHAADTDVTMGGYGEDIPGRPKHRSVLPGATIKPHMADAIYDRQVGWFGDRGHAQLGRLKVGVIGAGGVGRSLIVTLGRIGMGTIAVIDPDGLPGQTAARSPVRGINHPRGLLGRNTLKFGCC